MIYRGEPLLTLGDYLALGASTDRVEMVSALVHRSGVNVACVHDGRQSEVCGWLISNLALGHSIELLNRSPRLPNTSN
jgi:hypothetical protein